MADVETVARAGGFDFQAFIDVEIKKLDAINNQRRRRKLLKGWQAFATKLRRAERADPHR